MDLPFNVAKAVVIVPSVVSSICEWGGRRARIAAFSRQRGDHEPRHSTPRASGEMDIVPAGNASAGWSSSAKSRKADVSIHGLLRRGWRRDRGGCPGLLDSRTRGNQPGGSKMLAAMPRSPTRVNRTSNRQLSLAIPGSKRSYSSWLASYPLRPGTFQSVVPATRGATKVPHPKSPRIYQMIDGQSLREDFSPPAARMRRGSSSFQSKGVLDQVEHLGPADVGDELALVGVA